MPEITDGEIRKFGVVGTGLKIVILNRNRQEKIILSPISEVIIHDICRKIMVLKEAREG